MYLRPNIYYYFKYKYFENLVHPCPIPSYLQICLKFIEIKVEILRNSTLIPSCLTYILKY